MNNSFVRKTGLTCNRFSRRINSFVRCLRDTVPPVLPRLAFALDGTLGPVALASHKLLSEGLYGVTPQLRATSF